MVPDPRKAARGTAMGQREARHLQLPFERAIASGASARAAPEDR